MMDGDPVFDTLQKLAAGGWNDLDGMSEAFQKQHKTISDEQRQIADREAAIAKAALTTVEGKALLDLLLRKTILRPPGDDERAASTAEAYAIVKARREGQQGVVFMLLGMLQHDHGKPTPGGEL